MTGVYFAQVGSDRLKIGRSIDVERRCKAIQAGTGLKVVIIATIQCPLSQTIAVERRMLQRFRKFSITGEWHRLTLESIEMASSSGSAWVETPIAKPGPKPRAPELTRRNGILVKLTDAELGRVIEGAASADQDRLAVYVRQKALES